MKILNSLVFLSLVILTGCDDRTAFSKKHTTGMIRGYDYAFSSASNLEFDFKAPKSGSYFLMGWESPYRKSNELAFQLGFFANAGDTKTVYLDDWDHKPIKKLYRLDVIWSDGYDSELMETIIIEENDNGQ